MQPVAKDEPLPHEVPLPQSEPVQGQNTGMRANEMLRGAASFFDKTLHIYKLFYFFFFAAFGSLFPLISVYFKQLGMNATQVGLLVGCRSLIEFLAAPFWAALADKWRKGKLVLMASTLCWIVFTVIIGLVTPNPMGCLVASHNGSRMKHEVVETKGFGKAPEDAKRLIKNPHEKWSHMLGENPILLDKATGEAGLVIPRFSNVVYSQKEVNKAFIILLFLMVVGEFTSSPAIALADSATQVALDGKFESYGRQRMFGSIGWGIAMFVVGIGLDFSTKFFKHPCYWPGEHEKNYVLCFATFTVLMSCALIVSTQFSFDTDGREHMYLKIVKDRFRDSVINRGRSMKNRSELNEDEHEAPPTAKGNDEQILEEQLGIHGLQQPPPSRPAVDGDAQLNEYSLDGGAWQFKAWAKVLPLYLNPRLGAFLFVTFFMGIGNGIVFTLLFWHLQDIGGTPTLFGIASVINHVSEVLAYMHSDKLINKVGHIKVLYLGLLANLGRFLYVSLLQQPGWVLPFEFLQGLTHAATWAAVSSYIAQNIPTEARPASQGLLQGVHHGLGRGLGAVFGGAVTANYGSDVMFRTYSLVCTVVLLLFVALNFAWREAKLQSVPPGAQEANDRDEEPKEYFAGDSNFLAPHGVPLAPHRENSSHRISEQAGQPYQGGPPVAPYNPHTAAAQQPQQQQQQVYSATQRTGYNAGGGGRGGGGGGAASQQFQGGYGY